MTAVSRRARQSGDRAGDPLDGLVNLFDIGIVLAVAFLLAGLASVGATGALTSRSTRTPDSAVTVAPSDQARTLPPRTVRTIGNGTPIGRVYRLDDGRLVYVVPRSSGTARPTAAPTPSPTR